MSFSKSTFINNKALIAKTINEAVSNRKTKLKLINLLDDYTRELNELEIYNMYSLKEQINSSLSKYQCESMFFTKDITEIIQNENFYDDHYFKLGTYSTDQYYGWETTRTIKCLPLSKTIFDLFEYGLKNPTKQEEFCEQLCEIVPELKKVVLEEPGIKLNI